MIWDNLINPYPSPQLGGPLPIFCGWLKPTFAAISKQEFDGGGVNFNIEGSGGKIRRIRLVYAVLLPHEGKLLDNHNELMHDEADPFPFMHPWTNKIHQNARYASFDDPTWKSFQSQRRSTVLIFYP